MDKEKSGEKWESECIARWDLERGSKSKRRKAVKSRKVNVSHGGIWKGEVRVKGEKRCKVGKRVYRTVKFDEKK